MFKKLMIATAATAALGLTACGGGDENNSIVIEGDTVTTTNNNTTTPGGGTGSGGTPGSPSTCPTWASSRPIDDAGKNVCQLPGTITVSRTLDSDIVWYMAERVTVGNGNQEMSATKGVLRNGSPVLNVTLTIEPGTQIKGATGSFANLLITRGSRIMAEGTRTAPIVFSSDDADMSGPGEWGGLIIHGYGVHNVCGTDATVACNIDSEGESGFAGGYTENDNSGVLRYVVVTEGGFQFAPGNEINGISLMGVGSGTTLEYIQIHDNADDGIEYYGGTVDTKYLVVTGAGDDSIDWDEGFSGNIQYAIVRQNGVSEGNAIEADTDGSTTGFLSKPTLSNITFIGNGSATTMVVLKARSGGFLHNSILTAAPGSPITSCVTVSGAPAQALRNTAIAFNNIITNCGSFGDTVLNQSTVTAINPALSATYVPGVAAATLAAPIDFAAYNLSNPLSSAKTSFLDNTAYIGAVNPTGGNLWFQGWTLPGTL
jgi:hypothetical protein